MAKITRQGSNAILSNSVEYHNFSSSWPASPPRT